MTQTEQTEGDKKQIEPPHAPHDPILFNGEPINSIVINFDASGYEHDAWNFSEQRPKDGAGYQWPGKEQAYLIISTSDGIHVDVVTAHNYGTPLKSDALNWDLNEDYKEGDSTFDYVSIRSSEHDFLRMRWIVYYIEMGDTKLLEEHAINTKYIVSYEINTERRNLRNDFF